MTEHDPPSIHLSVLLADPSLGLRQVAGPAEDRRIGTVGTTEIEDPTPYLVGGELLLTAGVRLPPDADGIDTYVARVVAAGVAALGFGVAPVHEEIPAELIAACDRHGLPLLRLPPPTPFVAVGRATYAAIAEARNRDLKKVSQAQSALASAAARPDALQAVLTQLTAYTGSWAVLFDDRGNELFRAGRRPPEPVPGLLRDLAVRTTARPATGRAASGPPPPSAAAHHHDGVHLTVHTLPSADGTTTLALGQAAATAAVPLVHRQVTSTATVLLSLLTSPRHALNTDSHGVGALVRLMLGATPAEVAPALVPSEHPAHDHWVVVHGRQDPLHRSARAPRRGEDPAQLATLGTALGTPYLHIDGPALRALVPAAPGARPGAPAQAAALGWTLGFSAPSPAADLPRADARAERALQRAIAAEVPAVVHEATAPAVHSLVSPADAREFARARFAALDRAGPPGADVLLGTLRTWLTFHGSWDRTAAELQVHRNTVRHRMTRVAELLGADLQDPAVRMEFWFALEWLSDDGF
ncbi:helix-turn-helix domain-containing protein [Streptomyces sp. RTd22]|uniref:helix-turn-helix domain-containing protein n=1 Tax=Streptomyces sp. RTd22 TaxID=1841249 RepID=UPI0007C571D1|nr:PucR family transcriptional regulator [Streptomyces sp. RTd22]